MTPLELFVAAPPGLEGEVAREISEAGFSGVEITGGGVMLRGGWHDVWRANLELRCASRVLVRIGAFRVVHLAQLDKLARKLPWSDFLRADVPVKVDAVCRRSKLYHAGAVAQRIETAIHEERGAHISSEASVRVFVRVENNLCTVSVDTSGELLHKRGFKESVAKAPMRETLAALFLRACGYRATEPVFDPMCGSGTFIIEAAEMAAGLKPGRARSFAFEQLAGFDSEAWLAMKAASDLPHTALRFSGSDRDAGAIRASTANGQRAGVAERVSFSIGDVEDIQPPEGPPGLVIANPPYGARIGNLKALYGVYHALGQSLRERFSGWRVGLITSEDKLARATRLPFDRPGRPVDHGGIKIRLYQTKPLS
ncbi:MAG: RNA methyltransferase [Hyphobacterium sp.]|nr:MAG: RNA methyltransferase [Hyphobacterium sp.]